MMRENTMIAIWKSYGKYLVLGVIVAVLGYGGFQWRVQQRNAQMEQASLIYDKMISSFQQKENSKTEEQGKQLMTHYRGTPYAALAALLLARLQIEQNNLDKAVEHLQLAMKLGEEGPVGPIARVRLARVLASKQQFEQALKLLESEIILGYVPLIEEARGDIYVMQDHLDKAREAYTRALQALPMGVSVMSLQLKQNDLNLYKKEDS